MELVDLEKIIENLEFDVKRHPILLGYFYIICHQLTPEVLGVLLNRQIEKYKPPRIEKAVLNNAVCTVVCANIPDMLLHPEDFGEELHNLLNSVPAAIRDWNEEVERKLKMKESKQARPKPSNMQKKKK
jgi:hypothetical protein